MVEKAAMNESEPPDLSLVDAALRREAATHPAAGRRDVSGRPLSFERLEFLGDAVLGLVLAEALRDARPEAPEGELTACRAALASGASLAAVSRRLGLPEMLDAGDEPVSAARLRATSSAAENALEAMIGAVFASGGYPAAKTFVLAAFGDAIVSVRPVDSPKNRLQEKLQTANPGANAGSLVEYRTVSATGADHERRFVVEVWSAGAPLGRGQGPSLKAAGEAAARAALGETPATER